MEGCFMETFTLLPYPRSLESLPGTFTFSDRHFIAIDSPNRDKSVGLLCDLADDYLLIPANPHPEPGSQHNWNGNHQRD